jgi:hypothetical protein
METTGIRHTGIVNENQSTKIEDFFENILLQFLLHFIYEISNDKKAQESYLGVNR